MENVDVYVCYHTQDEAIIGIVKKGLANAGLSFACSPVSPPVCYSWRLELTRWQRFIYRITGKMERLRKNNYPPPLLPPANKELIDHCKVFLFLSTPSCFNSAIVVGEIRYAYDNIDRERVMVVIMQQGLISNEFRQNLTIYDNNHATPDWDPPKEDPVAVEKRIIPKIKRIIEDNEPPTGPCAHAFTLYKAKRFEEALKEYLELGAQGDAEAQYNLGAMYANGEGTAADAFEARRWYEKAVKQGIGRAAFNLARLYDEGRLIEGEPTREKIWNDKAHAARIYRQVAETGLMEAQYRLSVMLYCGEGVAESRDEAMQWYKKALEQGCPYAPPFLMQRFGCDDDE